MNVNKAAEETWVRGRDRLPGMFTKVKWRNADGGNIPLGEATPIEHYQRTGPNLSWHEWLDESQSQPPIPVEDEVVKVLDWLLSQSDKGQIEMVDGLFYYAEDNDGDFPMEAKDIYRMSKQFPITK